MGEGDDSFFSGTQKPHRKSKKDVEKKKEFVDTKGKNPKAFTVQNPTKVSTKIDNRYI